MLLLRFDILPSSKIISFTLDLQLSKTLFTNSELLITSESFLKLFKYINNYLNYNIRIGQTLKRRSAPIKELVQKHAIHSRKETPRKYGFSQLALQVN